MNDKIFAMSSLTYAYKGKDALYGEGVLSDIIRLNGRMTKRGCRYGLRVRGKDFNRAKAVLLKCGAVYSEII